MIAKLKKTSIKAVFKKKTSAPAATEKAPIPKESEKDPKKEHKSSLHRMLTAEGWKRRMLKKD
jgi:hypothetical protein